MAVYRACGAAGGVPVGWAGEEGSGGRCAPRSSRGVEGPVITSKSKLVACMSSLLSG
jgi:hypothetical protein